MISHLEKLEATLHATIATVESFEEHANVLTYSTNPDENIVKFDTHPSTEFQDRISTIASMVKEKAKNWPSVSSASIKIKKLFDDFLHQHFELGECKYLIQITVGDDIASSSSIFKEITVLQLQFYLYSSNWNC